MSEARSTEALRVVHVTHTVSAASACYRLHRALAASGAVRSTVAALRATVRDPEVRVARASGVDALRGLASTAAERALRIAWRLDRRYDFDPGRAERFDWRAIERLAPDVLHLHWIGGGVLSAARLGALPWPTVLTLHDSWAVTGGCHVPEQAGCARFEHGCGACPMLARAHDDDLTARTWRAKRRAWEGRPFELIAPSRWMADRASASPLLRDHAVHVVAHGIDLDTWRPVDRAAARAAFNLAPDDTVILTGAWNPFRDRNKGFDLACAAVRALGRGRANSPTLLVFGDDARPSTDLRVRTLGAIRDPSRLRALYAAADVTVVASRAESFSLVALESLACGTPVAAFDATGLRTVLAHRDGGWLAQPWSTDDLADGIAWLLAPANATAQREAARTRAVEHFSAAASVAAHARVYASLTRRSR